MPARRSAASRLFPWGMASSTSPRRSSGWTVTKATDGACVKRMSAPGAQYGRRYARKERWALMSGSRFNENVIPWIWGTVKAVLPADGPMNARPAVGGRDHRVRGAPSHQVETGGPRSARYDKEMRPCDS
jgi:hypothetical protein